MFTLLNDIDEVVRLEDALEHIAQFGTDYQSRSEYIGCWKPSAQQMYAKAFDYALEVSSAYGTVKKAQNAVEKRLREFGFESVNPFPLADEEPEEYILG